MEIKNKKCPQCKQVKELNSLNFYKSKRTKSGFRSWCKLCQNMSNKRYDSDNPEQLIKRVLKSRNRSEKSKQNHCRLVEESRQRRYPEYLGRTLMKGYNLTLEEYYEIIKIQGGGCGICGKVKDKTKRLAVDHCHTSGKVRGVLCQNCNMGLGKFMDNPLFLEKAADYLVNNLSTEEDDEAYRSCQHAQNKV